MRMHARVSAALTLLLALLLLASAHGQTYRLGAEIGPGTAVELPEVQTTAGGTVIRGVPTVVVFAQVQGCDLCEAVGDITSRWLERYPDIQVVVVEIRSARAAIEAWGEAHGVPIVHDSDFAFRNAFDTNLTQVFLLDGDGIVRDKVRPLQRAQWVHLERQVARA